MTDTVDAPSRDLAQERRLVTELPGPRSRELIARRTAAVSAGVGTMLPVGLLSDPRDPHGAQPATLDGGRQRELLGLLSDPQDPHVAQPATLDRGMQRKLPGLSSDPRDPHVAQPATLDRGMDGRKA